ncbi:MAG TPA: hypothetical protein VMH36_17965 [Alphaproteobacteria bacterium]|nr:hypothetical protein [Alphaproteobacteria bacterium]
MKEPDRIEASRRPLEDCEPAILRQLYTWWNEARGARPWLLHADLRPWEFAAALPHIALIERPPPDKPGMRIRLVGEEIRNQRFGYVRGNLVEQIGVVLWYRDHLVARYHEAFAEAAPSFESVRVFHEFKRIFYNRLILPLTSDGAAADILMVATVNVNPPEVRLEPEDHLA